jgi:glycosyltransferase involved in cell wall biosynthesis
MKILLDPQIFIYQKFGGISRFFTEMYKFCDNNNDVEIDLPLFYSDNIHLSNYQIKNNYFLDNYNFKGKNFFIEKINQYSYEYVKKSLKKNKYDIFIPTYFDDYYLNYLNNTPFVLTVHDMINELYPNYFASTDNIPFIKKKLIQKANKIIAVSENTKIDILKFYPDTDPNLIEVIHRGFSMEIGEIDTKYKNILETKYILFVGNRTTYKNFIWLINTISEWLIENNTSIYCVGGGNFTNEELLIINNLNISNYLFQFNVLDKDLFYFYNKALFFVFPSEYEGFGLPILESFSCSCPIILPSSSSFPEVAGNAGIYYAINNKSELLNCFNRVITDNIYRDEKIKNGNLQLKKFSWFDTIEKSLIVYKNVCNV